MCAPEAGEVCKNPARPWSLKEEYQPNASFYDGARQRLGPTAIAVGNVSKHSLRLLQDLCVHVAQKIREDPLLFIVRASSAKAFTNDGTNFQECAHGRSDRRVRFGVAALGRFGDLFHRDQGSG